MSEKFKIGCVRPQSSTEPSSESQETSVIQESKSEKGDSQKMIKVGKPAPQFTAAAYHNGEFVNLSLDEFRGKWVVLCFYPGDFTFV
jgi:peroxiredoxin (alkyl hydroperoxide reductase subunit C)